MVPALRALACLFVLASGVGQGAAQEPEQTAPFFTTPDEVTVQMLRFAGTGPADFVVDLGSGDGRIVIAAAREFGARGLGIEIDSKLVALSRERAQAAGVDQQVSFTAGDVLRADFSRASVVTVYLLPALIDRLQPRLLDELAPGTRIVSHAFAMRGWAPDRTQVVRLSRRHEGQGDTSALHLWVVPAKVRGTWRESSPSSRDGFELSIRQDFQKLDIDARREGTPLAVGRVALEGRRLRWEAGEMRFDGEVKDERIVGELAGPTGRRSLELHRVR